jgi:hypothetical protein
MVVATKEEWLVGVICRFPEHGVDILTVDVRPVVGQGS